MLVLDDSHITSAERDELGEWTIIAEVGDSSVSLSWMPTEDDVNEHVNEHRAALDHALDHLRVVATTDRIAEIDDREIDDDEIREAIRAADRIGDDNIRTILSEAWDRDLICLRTPSVPAEPLPLGHDEGDPDVLWQNRVHAALGDDVSMRKVNTTELYVRAWSEGNSTFERVLKGLPGWRVGGQFVPLHAVLDVGHEDLRTIVEIAIARSREVRKAETERFKAWLDSGEVEEDEEPSQPSPYRMADTAHPGTIAAGRAM